MQRIKHKDIAECKWSNCQQAHHPLLCDKPRVSQAVLHAYYEEDNGEDEEKHDETDDTYFTMKDGDNFFATGEESNENQGGADGDNE